MYPEDFTFRKFIVWNILYLLNPKVLKTIVIHGCIQRAFPASLPLSILTMLGKSSLQSVLRLSYILLQ